MSKSSQNFPNSSSNCLRRASRIIREFVGILEHVELAYDMTPNSHFIYCHRKILTAESYQQHLPKKHGMPNWDELSGFLSTPH